MAGISTRFECFAALDTCDAPGNPALGFAVWLGLLFQLAAAPAQSKTLQADPPLCLPSETVIAACTSGRRVATVCGLARGQAVYRFQRAGRTEMQARGLHYARRMYSGGGETQIHFSRGRFHYILFDSTIRTGFGADGHNDPEFVSKLLVQQARKTIKSMSCEGGTAVLRSTFLENFVPSGNFIEH